MTSLRLLRLQLYIMKGHHKRDAKIIGKFILHAFLIVLTSIPFHESVHLVQYHQNGWPVETVSFLGLSFEYGSDGLYKFSYLGWVTPHIEDEQEMELFRSGIKYLEYEAYLFQGIYIGLMMGLLVFWLDRKARSLPEAYPAFI